MPGVQGKGALDRLYTEMSAFSEEDFVPIAVPAGSVAFFNTHVVHGSKSNRTDENRRALVLTYQPHLHPMWKVPGIRPVNVQAA